MVGKRLQITAMRCGVLLAACGVASAQTFGGGDDPAPLSEAAQDASGTTWYVDPELIDVLQREAARRLSAHLQAQGKPRPLDVAVSMDMPRKRIVADIGKGYLPGPDGDEVFRMELATTLRHLAEAAGLRIDDVDLLFQGKPLEHHYPKKMARPTRSR